MPFRAAVYLPPCDHLVITLLGARGHAGRRSRASRLSIRALGSISCCWLCKWAVDSSDGHVDEESRSSAASTGTSDFRRRRQRGRRLGAPPEHLSRRTSRFGPLL